MNPLSRDQIIHLAASNTLTARVTPPSPDRLAWIGVFSTDPKKTLYLNSAEIDALGQLQVIYFEVYKHDIEMMYDIHAEEMHNVTHYHPPSIEQLYTILDTYGVDARDLRFKNETGYPV